MKNRKLYAKVSRDSRGKKVCNFGKVWGKMSKEDSNTECTRTGEGMWVLDVDTKDMSKLPKKMVKLLGEPTVETANGYHYYFEGEGIPQTQKLVDMVDVRNEGGLVFSKYKGDDKDIWYKEVGKTQKPSTKLMKYLTKLQGKQVKRNIDTLKLSYKDGEPWKQFKDGEQHNMLMATMIKMFNDRKTEAEVWSRAQEYQQNYLSGSGYNERHETKLMNARLNWAMQHIGADKIKGKVLPQKPRKKKAAPKAKKKGGKKNPWKSYLLKKNDKFNKAEADKVNEMEFLSFLPKHHHTVVYGASGTMKTSIIAKEMIEQAKADKKLEVFLFSFDASALHNRAIWRRTEAEGVSDQFHLFHNSKKESVFEFIDRAEEKGYDLDDAVFIIDTYKKIANGVNDKGQNEIIMSHLKRLTMLGATVITLAHTNKDGLTNSGTAELEQDSDGLLRFDAHKDENMSTISITEGGRVRYKFDECTYRCPKGESYDDVMEGLEQLDEYIDVATIQEKEKTKAKSVVRDTEKIDDIRGAISEGHDRLTPIAEVTGHNKQSVRRALRKYEGVHWRVKEEHPQGGSVYELLEELG